MGAYGKDLVALVTAACARFIMFNKSCFKATSLLVERALNCCTMCTFEWVTECCIVVFTRSAGGKEKDNWWGLGVQSTRSGSMFYCL